MPKETPTQQARREILLRRAGVLMEEFGFAFERAYRLAVMWMAQDEKKDRLRRKHMKGQPAASKVYDLEQKKRLLDPAHERLAARLARSTGMSSEKAHRIASQTARDVDAGKA